MKKILLRIAGVWPEMCRRKARESFGTDTAFGKVKLAERFHDPYIHRKGLLKSIREKQDAVGDLITYTGKLHQFDSRLLHRSSVQARQADFLSGDHLRCTQEIRRAKSHFASTQISFRARGEAFGRWK